MLDLLVHQKLRRFVIKYVPPRQSPKNKGPRAPSFIDDRTLSAIEIRAEAAVSVETTRRGA